MDIEVFVTSCDSDPSFGVGNIDLVRALFRSRWRHKIFAAERVDAAFRPSGSSWVTANRDHAPRSTFGLVRLPASR